MKVKLFEGFDSGEYNYKYGGHCFVFARPKSGWSRLNPNFRDDEFVPCMISGFDYGQRIWFFGSQYAYRLIDFEVIEGSDKELQDLNDMYSYKKI